MKIGILGAGQLSRMLALAGLPLGLEFVFYDTQNNKCVEFLGPMVNAGYDDEASLKTFANAVDVITLENENIPTSTIETLTNIKPVYPSAKALEVSQDRLVEKDYLNSLGIPTTEYHPINSKQDLLELLPQLTYPFFIKKRRLGYDGKGQVCVRDEAQIAAVTDEQCENCIIEAGVDFDREVSIVACRSQQGEMRFYDLCENEHRDGILVHTMNKINDPQHDAAKKYIASMLEDLAYVGVCTLEMFAVGEKLIANEMAPRVHNSGHWTIEGAVTSQFENHVRCVAGLPLGSTASYGNFHMYNLLGNPIDRSQWLEFDGVHLHDYIKEPRPGRKLGHVTLADDFNTQNRSQLLALI